MSDLGHQLLAIDTSTLQVGHQLPVGLAYNPLALAATHAPLIGHLRHYSRR
jgi:hypothetical protein